MIYMTKLSFDMNLACLSGRKLGFFPNLKTKTCCVCHEMFNTLVHLFWKQDFIIHWVVYFNVSWSSGFVVFGGSCEFYLVLVFFVVFVHCSLSSVLKKLGKNRKTTKQLTNLQNTINTISFLVRIVSYLFVDLEPWWPLKFLV